LGYDTKLQHFFTLKTDHKKEQHMDLDMEEQGADTPVTFLNIKHKRTSE
jgi:hypothetical protein